MEIVTKLFLIVTVGSLKQKEEEGKKVEIRDAKTFPYVLVLQVCFLIFGLFIFVENLSYKNSVKKKNKK